MSLDREVFKQDYEKLKLSRSGAIGRSMSNRCSLLGHPCFAYLVYDRTVEAQDRRSTKERLSMVFDEGRVQESTMKQDLEAMGYEVLDAQRQLSWPKYQIVGHGDFRIKKRHEEDSVRCEFKSVSPFLFAKIKTAADLRDHKLFYIKKWYTQVALYMWLSSVERYWLILKNKASGEIEVIEFQINDQLLQDIEEILQKVVAINKLVTAYYEQPVIEGYPEIAPDDKISDPELCTECEFYQICQPPLHFDSKLVSISDPEMEAALERRESLIDPHREYGSVDDFVKEWVKGRLPDGEGAVIVGPWVVIVKKTDKKTTVKITKQEKANAGH